MFFIQNLTQGLEGVSTSSIIFPFIAQKCTWFSSENYVILNILPRNKNPLKKKVNVYFQNKSIISKVGGGGGGGC